MIHLSLSDWEYDRLMTIIQDYSDMDTENFIMDVAEKWYYSEIGDGIR